MNLLLVVRLLLATCILLEYDQMKLHLTSTLLKYKTLVFLAATLFFIVGNIFIQQNTGHIH